MFSLVLSVSLLTPSAVQAAQKEDFEVKEKIFVHYPRVDNSGKAPKGAVCTTEGDDKVTDFKLTGWQLPEEGVVYRINSASFPAGITASYVKNAITNAFAAWNSADPGKIFIEGMPTTEKRAIRDGVNLIAWAPVNSSALAITYTWYRTDTGTVLESDTIFNSRVPWTVLTSKEKDCVGNVLAYDVQDIATHEFGHWVGLDDLYDTRDSALTMYGYGSLGEVKKDTLGAGDKAALSYVGP